MSIGDGKEISLPAAVAIIVGLLLTGCVVVGAVIKVVF
jgi:hypothetical protein